MWRSLINPAEYDSDLVASKFEHIIPLCYIGKDYLSEMLIEMRGNTFSFV